MRRSAAGRHTIEDVSSEPPTPVGEVARILARLSHRFADREAILWRAGYDETSWTTLEAEATRLLLADADRGEPGAIVAFARALLEARAALLFANQPQSTDHESATTLPRGDRVDSGARATRPIHFADPETTTSEGNSPFVPEPVVPPPPAPKQHLAITLNSQFSPVADKPRR